MRNVTPLLRLIRTISLIAISLLLTLKLSVAPAFSQTASPTATPQATSDRATVALDGQPLFEISSAGQYSAQERAKLINLQLKDAVESSDAINVKIEQRNQSPTLLLNDSYLLTVTERDAKQGNTPEEEAYIWANKIQTAVQQAQQERNPTYIQRVGGVAVGILLLVSLLHWLLGWVQRQVSRSLRQRLTTPAEANSDHQPSRPIEQSLKLLLAIARVGLWVAAVLYITNLFPVTRSWSYQATNALISSFTSPIITLGNNAYSVTDLLFLAVLMAALVVFAGTVTSLLRSRVLSIAGISRGGQEVISILTKYGLIMVGALVLLQIWGLDISSLTILASALGVGIGFGFQDIAKNFGSGLVLVLERPIQVGDFIQVGDSKGTVERIGGRSTEIRTLDHVSIIVPNSRFLEEEVINWSHGNPVSRLHLPVGVAYSSDPKAVRIALMDAAQSHTEVLRHPPPQVFFKGFGDSSLDFELLVWTSTPHRQFILSSDLYYRVFEILAERNIEIPFPQRDLHVRSGTLSLAPQSGLHLIDGQDGGDKAEKEGRRDEDF